MNILLKSVFSVLRYSFAGYFLLLVFMVFNKYISFSLTHQYDNPETKNFAQTIFYIVTNKLSVDDFVFCLYGLVFMLFVGLLRNFERRTRIY
jgi:hypothetical protein